MDRNIQRIVVVALAAATLLALTALSSVAQEYPPDTEDYALICADAVAGETVTFSVVGAADGETLEFTSDVGSATEVADASGTATFGPFTVPSDAAGSTITATVVGSESGEASCTAEVQGVAADAGVAVTEVLGTTLARTGAQVTGLVAIGGLLLAGGMLALRRRQRAAHSA